MPSRLRRRIGDMVGERSSGRCIQAAEKYWVNSGSKSRHNSKCDWFGRTKRGVYTDDASAGKPCGGCGG